MKNCLECGKSVPDNRKFCSPACKRKWHNTQYYKAHRDEMKLSFKNRYRKITGEKIQRNVQFVITKVGKNEAISLLALPSDKDSKRQLQDKHRRMHGRSTFRLERFTYSVIVCTHCDENLAVNLP